MTPTFQITTEERPGHHPSPAFQLGHHVCTHCSEGSQMSLPHKLKVREDESFVDVKATGNDVFRIFQSVAVCLLQSQVLPQVLLIIRHLDDQRYIEHILQPPTKHERYL